MASCECSTVVMLNDPTSYKPTLSQNRNLLVVTSRDGAEDMPIELGWIGIVVWKEGRMDGWMELCSVLCLSLGELRTSGEGRKEAQGGKYMRDNRSKASLELRIPVAIMLDLGGVSS